MRGDAPELADQALRWLVGAAEEEGAGLCWPDTPGGEVFPTLYGGTAGVVLALLEADRHFADDHYGDAALRGARWLAEQIETWDHCALYFGLTGMALALHAVAELLGDDQAGAASSEALATVRSRFDGERWSDQFELLGGNAGIALGALQIGDVELAELAVDPYLRRAEPTAHGVQWEVRSGVPARLHHLSHGTLGIALALATVGEAAGRSDLVELALAGAADVVVRNIAGPDDFLVPHSDPQHRPELIERISYGWCHGPAGDAQVFRKLAAVTGDGSWSALAERCWHTVVASGLPRRLRPGFWDNSGRCCGTAGVLALACDRQVELGEEPSFADVLVADLADRATVDGDGARWSNVEHRVTPSELEPRTGWAMGSAGIVRELLRYVRLGEGGDPAYAVAWPDQLVATRATDDAASAASGEQAH